MYIPWDSKYEIGHPDLDGQHKYLFSIANELFSSSDPKTLLIIFTKLFKYVVSHFKDEARLMEGYEYPLYLEHTLLHGLRVEKLREFRTSLLLNELDISEVHSFMTTWLLKHIAIEDTKFISFMNSHKELS